ncbi:MAG TPA: DUF397 domain-containing protein [Pseudonocardiaceae bacterium]|nr:DUF397 domain-containing protein [Pseudonocardiaceae bacterium]
MNRDTGWFKSSYSDSGNDQCVEVRIQRGTVGVRDSKNRAEIIQLSPAAWADFVRDLVQ